MAGVITRIPAIGTDTRIQTHIARGSQMLAGSISLSAGSTYVAGGVTVTFPIKNLGAVTFEHRVVTASVLFYGYDRTNTRLQIFQPVGPAATSGILLGGEIASDTVITALTAIYFFAIGRD